jgi:hypothetical protein
MLPGVVETALFIVADVVVPATGVKSRQPAVRRLS